MFCKIYQDFSIITLVFCAQLVFAGGRELPDPFVSIQKNQLDTIPLKDRSGDFTQEKDNNPFDLDDPKAVQKTIEYDPETGQYILTEKIGDEYFRPPTSLSFEEYLEFKRRQQDKEYYKNLAGISTSKRNTAGFVDPVSKIDLKRNLADKLFGGLGVEIKPQGSIDLTLGAFYNYNDNPIQAQATRGQFGPNFDMDIQLDVTGSIGDKLKLNTNYNSTPSFDFDNKLKLEYDSEKFSEDDIIKKIEAGNVSLPLRSNLIQGSQNLFGFKTDWQFGYLRLTGIVSQQKSKQENIQIKGGGVIQEYEVRPDEYDDNRHFFLAHYFRDAYEGNLINLPEISSKFKIKQVEVWITEDGQNSRETNVRDIVALTDLGTPEGQPFDYDNPARLVPGRKNPKDVNGKGLPTNTANKLYEFLVDTNTRDLNTVVRKLTDPNGFNLKQGRDFEKVRARKLSSNDYIFNPDLGFISLRIRPRPNQVLAIAYNYTYNGREVDPRTDAKFKVGEFSSEIRSDSTSPRVIYVKMLKSSTQNTMLPSWDLMMKNVYPIGGYNLNEEDFTFDIFYEAQDGIQKRYIEELQGYPLLNLFRLDFLNKTKDPQPDGVFDFIPGQTVVPASGSVIFPVLEPFGRSMLNLFQLVDPAQAQSLYEKYGYPELYDTSVTAARRELKSNQFLLKGKYKSGKSNEINLQRGNLDPNAKVTVSAGSNTLVEGSDYTVDRNLGKITILNTALIQSDVPINVNFEDNSLFSFQTKTMLGLRAEYSKRKDFYIGMTYMNLFERPFTQKVNLGEDPINNKIYGLDFGLSKTAPWLTRAIDKLPLFSTKEASRWSLQAEGALLDPGHSRAINQAGSNGGVIYIDDFEGSSTGIGLYFNTAQWILAASPQGLDSREEAFRAGNVYNNLISSSNRALLSWYRIDEYARVSAPDAGHSYSRLVDEKEIFPNKNRQVGFTTEVTFDLNYYPNLKGPYNYDIPGGYFVQIDSLTSVRTPGIDRLNNLLEPENRWGGIMTKLTTNDFEASNVEYVDFWLLNPFMSKHDNSPVSNDGRLYLQLGNFSEDILKDGRQQFEHGLPTKNLNLPFDTTTFGKIARKPPITNAFDINERELQDLGLDGLNSVSDEIPNEERIFFQPYVDALQNFLDPVKFAEVFNDPSNDDYISYRSQSLIGQTVLNRYKRYNMPEANGQIEEGTNQSTAYTGYPDVEDLNNDKSLNEIESYFNYGIEINKSPDNKIEFDFNQTDNLITDTIVIPRANGEDEIWYRYRVPLSKFQKVGEINDFRSIQGMRLLLTGFDESVTFRFIKFQLGRNTWRRYDKSGCTSDQGNDPKPLILDKVDIEENAEKIPINYKTPKGIEREKFYSAQYQDLLQNESSLLLRKEDFAGNCEQSIYRILDLDLRKYTKLKMFVHAESVEDLNKGDVCIFLRLGKDFTDNYYEYSIPLRMTSKDATSAISSDSIWLVENEFDFDLQSLINLKNLRNAQGGIADSFSIMDPNKLSNKMTIIGNPSIGQIRGIQIGIRNKTSNVLRDVEVWLNELRLTGLDEKGGFAAQARAELQLADLGNVSMATNFSTIGWGGIDQKLSDRANAEVILYDVTGTVELGKFLPKKTGIRIPFTSQYSIAHRTPEYDPNDTDVKLKDKLANARSKQERDSIKERSTDLTNIRSFAFNNVRKERTGTKKPMPWNVENFGLNYSQSVTDKRNEIVSSDHLKSQQGGIDYNFSISPKYIEPFKKIVKSNYLKFISDFNFNLLPNSFSIRNNLERRYGKKTYRFADPAFATWEEVKFSWLRDYALNWDFTRSLKFNFNAQTEAAVDEITYNPLRRAYIDPLTNGVVTERDRKPFLLNNIKDLGRTKDYKHNFTVSYNIPTRLIPFMDWVNARAQYTANYNWAGGSLRTVDSLGSVISNGQNISLSGELNLVTLYNKIPYLRRINGESSPSRIRPAQKKPANKEDKKGEKKEKKTEEKNKPEAKIGVAEKVLIRPLLSVRRLQLNFQNNRSTVIPGYTLGSELLGTSDALKAPGWSFISGLQPNFKQGGWLDDAADKGWISANMCLNKEMSQRNSKTFGAKLKIEPFKDFNIDLNVDRTFIKDHTEAFKFDSVFGTNTQDFQHFSPFDNGQLTISFLSLQTLFNRDIDQLFVNFSDTRTAISKRVGEQYGITNPSQEDPDYVDGFGGDHVDVVIPSFISAYSKTNPQKVKLDVFKTLPMPNWSVNYSGLSRLNFMKDLFQDFSIRHAYKNTLTMNEYRTNLDYKEVNNIPEARKRDTTITSYYSRYEIPEVIVNENFNPLIGLSIKTKNGIELGIDVNKNRNLRLQNSIDGQLEETNGTAYNIKAGYTIKNVYLSFIPGIEKINKNVKKKSKKKKKNSKEDPAANANKPKGNDLEFTFDFSIRDDIKKLHKLDQNTIAQAVSGSKQISFTPAVKYNLSKNLNLRLFVDYRKTLPYVLDQYKTVNVNGGLTVQFLLN
ncbi:MAG: cell surface protein SprA [Bacteroidota bacterium]|nr:cell surface protein SprA [Bacteroidota bacterium]